MTGAQYHLRRSGITDPVDLGRQAGAFVSPVEVAPHSAGAAVGQRRTRGIPSPIHEMISRWISLLPPPKVKMTADR